jgi:hypothetical protein
MQTTMIRKQVYLAPEQDRKLKSLASRRRCTEAEIIREALDRLPNPDTDDVEAKLSAAGVLAPAPDFPDVPRGRAAQALEAEFERWLAEQPPDTDLGDDVIRDRAESEARLQ